MPGLGWYTSLVSKELIAQQMPASEIIGLASMQPGPEAFLREKLFATTKEMKQFCVEFLALILQNYIEFGQN